MCNATVESFRGHVSGVVRDSKLLGDRGNTWTSLYLGSALTRPVVFM